MRSSLVITVFQILTWCCVVLLAVLSLWPGRGRGFLFVMPELNTMRTGLPGKLEHFITYAGSAAIAMLGYGAGQGSIQIHRRLLDLRRHSGVPPALLAGPASVVPELRGLGTRILRSAGLRRRRAITHRSGRGLHNGEPWRPAPPRPTLGTPFRYASPGSASTARRRERRGADALNPSKGSSRPVAETPRAETALTSTAVRNHQTRRSCPGCPSS
jgi:hypothetical protein